MGDDGQYDFYDGTPPHQVAETSLTAAVEIKPKTQALREQVYEYIRKMGIYGATDQEVQLALGMDGSTERPRRCELTEKKRVELSPLQRRTTAGKRAQVWVASVWMAK